jgi:hypothetical protein
MCVYISIPAATVYPLVVASYDFRPSPLAMALCRKDIGKFWTIKMKQTASRFDLPAAQLTSLKKETAKPFKKSLYGVQTARRLILIIRAGKTADLRGRDHASRCVALHPSL